MNKMWSGLFIFLAILNEIVWRTQTTDTWVNFKVFGIMGITIIFTIIQIPLLKKHLISLD
jgi:intracellular septation protein